MMSGRLSRIYMYFSLFLLLVVIFGVFILKWRVMPITGERKNLQIQLSECKAKILALENVAKMGRSGDTGTNSLTDQLANAKAEIERLNTVLSTERLLKGSGDVLPLIKQELGRKLNLAEASKLIVDQVTFVLFSFNESSLCLKGRLDSVEKNYPGAHIVVISSAKMSEKPASGKIDYVPSIHKEGKALDIMESKVKTKYFLYLSSGVSISPDYSDQSIGWLYHALETVPEVDFVGGAVLSHERGVKYPLFEAPCHRLRVCNWTFSQSFEYRYSVDDMMICEETSGSFMGRTTSLEKVGHFDQTLDVMATTDFFLRAKGKAVVALRPEVFFLIQQTCAQFTPHELKTRFMVKHGVFVLKDSLGREVRAEQLKNFNFQRDITGIDYYHHDTYAKPYFLEGLKLHLETGADYLEEQNITYYIDGGVSLGAVKFRGMLPWDSGDIDLYYVAPWRDVKRGLEEHCKKKGMVHAKVNTVPMNDDKQELMLCLVGDERPRFGPRLGVNTMFEEGKEMANQDLYMYIYIHGRRYPVLRKLFQHLRKYYGIHYLEMQGHHTEKRLKCKIPGHHACVPAEFSTGPGGHWRDFYCQI